MGSLLGKKTVLVVLSTPQAGPLSLRRRTVEKPILRWLKTVSSAFQDLKSLMDHYNYSLSVNATNMVSTKCPIIGEQVAVNIVAQ